MRKLVTGRAVGLHAVLLLALVMCGVAAWWQVGRALSGNALSWVYVFEWPAFAGISVWLWWVLITGAGRPRSRSGPGPDRGLAWDRESESAKLRAYNAYLAELNGSGRR